MNHNHVLDACPLCNTKHPTDYLEVTDYMISRESFNLVKCPNCSFIYTNPCPSPEDIQKYYDSPDYISHTEQKNGLLNTIYYLARQFMHHQKSKWLKELIGSPGKVLDFGCGTGSFVEFLLNKKWDAWGIEPNHGARAIANRKTSNRVASNFDHHPTDQFQIITLWHVLEHLHGLDSMIDQFKSHLQPQGYLVFALPNCSSMDANYYQQYWAGYDVPRHLWHFTPETMKVLVKKYNLRLIKTIPLKLDAFYVSMLSERYRKGSLFAALIQGIRSNLAAIKNQEKYSSLVYIIQK